MATEAEKISIGGKQYRKFWPLDLSKPVTDGTVRCIFCGQIDEPEHHEDMLCCASNEWQEVEGRS